MNMKNIAIIPARSGSKGLPDKNIKLLNGKPLMAYSIEAANNSCKFEIIHVSTDNEKYAAIAREYGADVPFLRSTNNSSDAASSWAVVKEVLEKYRERGKEFDTFMLLQPTSPLRTENDIISAYDTYINRKANAVVSVSETDHSPLWCNTLPENSDMCYFLDPQVKNLPRQNIPKYYRIYGAIYLAKTSYFEESDDIYRENCIAYIMKQRSIDIDTIDDFYMCECLLKNKMLVYSTRR